MRLVGLVNDAVQVPPQLMPEGLEVTVPEPVLVMVTGYEEGGAM